MLEYVILIIAIGFVYESCSWFFRIYTSYSWIKKERSIFNNSKNTKSSGKVFILLPVLAEADILENTVKYFNSNFLENKDGVFLVIITTEKENMLGNSGRNTIDVAIDLANKHLNVSRIHFTEQNGKMAHQLNYAVNNLIDSGSLSKSNDLIAVFNADSRPEKETFDWVQRKFKDGKYSAFQQYGSYSENMLKIDCVHWSSVLLSGSLWQTRWSVGFEIYNALKQLKFKYRTAKINMNYPFNYCIGHGLFITREVFEKVGGFSENTHNEDAILGLQLSEMQELLMPIPYFDISESPDTVEMLYKQKSNWYFGPLQAYSYMWIILNETKHKTFGKIRLFLLSTKLFMHAIFWILGPTLMLLGLILAVVSGKIALIGLSLLGLGLFAVPSIMAYVVMLEIGAIPRSFTSTKMTVSLLTGFFIFYVMHGASAYRGLYKYIKQLLSRTNAVKEKTIIKRG